MKIAWTITLWSIMLTGMAQQHFDTKKCQPVLPYNGTPTQGWENTTEHVEFDSTRVYLRLFEERHRNVLMQLLSTGKLNGNLLTNDVCCALNKRMQQQLQFEGKVLAVHAISPLPQQPANPYVKHYKLRLSYGRYSEEVHAYYLELTSQHVQRTAGEDLFIESAVVTCLVHGYVEL